MNGKTISPEEREARLQYRRRLWAKHKERWNTERRQQHAANPEQKREREREYHAAHRDEKNAKRRTKRASDPEHRRHLRQQETASYWRHRDRNIASARQRYWANPDAERSAKRAHYKRNPKTYNESAKRYRDSDHGKAVCRRAARSYYELHRAELIKRSVARMYLPEVRAWQAARRALKKGTAVGSDREAYVGFLLLVQTAPVLPCNYCGKELGTGKRERHCDHVMPLSRGGADCVSNLCVSCERCNCMKGNKTPDEFRIYLRTVEPSHPFAV